MKAQPDHYYGFGPRANICMRCGIIRRQRLHPNGQAKTQKPEWSSDGGDTWSGQHTACPGYARQLCVVFDWQLATEIVKGYKPIRAYAASHSQGRVLIWANGQPAPKPAFKFAGTEVLELIIGEEIWNCMEKKSDHPDWNEDTYWPLVEAERSGRIK